MTFVSSRRESSVRRRRSLAACLLILVAVLLTAAPAHAQAVYGSIAGIVTDPSGAALPGATVTITSLERKTSDTVVTQASGLAEFEFWRVGPFDCGQ